MQVMQERLFYFYTPQPNPKYHCQTVNKNVQRYPCWASIKTTGETLQLSTLTGKEVRLDILASGFRQGGQITFFDMRVFNPNTKRYVNQDI